MNGKAQKIRHKIATGANCMTDAWQMACNTATVCYGAKVKDLVIAFYQLITVVCGRIFLKYES